ncbi:hypothetical protein DFJ74DRAFT_441186 [Hyaloraphidium curvatum]|nr:hypothetical protein DFJ74DRAFT_441186 [Hyaloraphidium curvatum]
MRILPLHLARALLLFCLLGAAAAAGVPAAELHPSRALEPPDGSPGGQLQFSGLVRRAVITDVHGCRCQGACALSIFSPIKKWCKTPSGCGVREKPLLADGFWWDYCDLGKTDGNSTAFADRCENGKMAFDNTGGTVMLNGLDLDAGTGCVCCDSKQHSGTFSKSTCFEKCGKKRGYVVSQSGADAVGPADAAQGVGLLVPTKPSGAARRYAGGLAGLAAIAGAAVGAMAVGAMA